MDKKKQKEYEKQLIDFVKKYKIMRWSHIEWSKMEFSKRTAYNFDLHNLQTIKDELENNRSGAMTYLLTKWIKSDNPTLQIAAMRIVSCDETHRKLNQSYVQNDVTVNEDNLKSLKQLFSADDESE